MANAKLRIHFVALFNIFKCILSKNYSFHQLPLTPATLCGGDGIVWAVSNANPLKFLKFSGPRLREDKLRLGSIFPLDFKEDWYSLLSAQTQQGLCPVRFCG